METADMVIVGAGWYGLAMAKTYGQVNPAASIIVLDRSESIGGVWAKERLYSFKTNNKLGSFEFSDFPMTTEHFGLSLGQHIPSSKVCEYLRLYADKFDIARLIRFDCNVKSAELIEDGTWILTMSKSEPSESEAKLHRMAAKKLVVATGILSQPFVPELKGSGTFKGPLFHTQQLGKHEVVLRDKSVVVFGASKSAWDSCYLAATQGCEVHWVIRASGNGPTWVVPQYATPLKLPMEVLLTTRFLTWFNPTFWGDADAYGAVQRFLHGTWLGRKITAEYWALMEQDVIQVTGYNESSETIKLKGRNSAFWQLSSANSKNYDTDFMALIHQGKIKIHIADISHLSENAVHLSDDNELKADALICATGWKQGAHTKFLPEGIDPWLGMPHYSATEDELAEKGDKVILEKFPVLANQPVGNPNYTPLTSSTYDARRPNQPFRLYRILVPASPQMFRYRIVSIMSAHHVTLKPILVQLQALWLTAYFDNKIALLSDDGGLVRDAVVVALLQMEMAVGRWWSG